MSAVRPDRGDRRAGGHVVQARRALGASDSRILQLLVWQGGRYLGLGAVIALPFTAVARDALWKDG